MKDVILASLLKDLHLPTFNANYIRLAKQDEKKIMYLQELATLETEKRKENGDRARVISAKFPLVKTIDTFDFSKHPVTLKKTITDLLAGEYIDTKSSVVFLGPPGVGKTHLACGLGYAACRQGRRVLFTTAADLLMSLVSAKKDDKIKQRLVALDRFDLLILDELGYIPFEKEATDLLYQVISRRYERGSFIITTNLDFPEWTNVFPSAAAASAVVDRIVHHAHIFELSGNSYRLASRSSGGRTASGSKVPEVGSETNYR
jgi:DNA replication protein DnaC